MPRLTLGIAPKVWFFSGPGPFWKRYKSTQPQCCGGKINSVSCFNSGVITQNPHYIILRCNNICVVFLVALFDSPLVITSSAAVNPKASTPDHRRFATRSHRPRRLRTDECSAEHGGRPPRFDLSTPPTKTGSVQSPTDLSHQMLMFCQDADGLLQLTTEKTSQKTASQPRSHLKYGVVFSLVPSSGTSMDRTPSNVLLWALALLSLNIQSYLLRYGDWRHSDVGFEGPSTF